MIHQRHQLIKVEQSTFLMPDQLFDGLSDVLNELADKIEKNQNDIPVLEKINALGYSTTGNGYYLYQKGIIKF